MRRFAIIVAGGSGTRMKSKVPKQFLLLGGKPILMRTLENWFHADKKIKIILVLPASQIDVWKKICKRYSFKINHEIAEGGTSRFQSVKNGLEKVNAKGVVAVHDGVRPLASVKLINKCFTKAERFGNSVPCVSVNESLRELNGKKNVIADRNSFVIIQTPQCFDSEILKKAYKQKFKKEFTDDASVAEAIGVKIYLVEGERENIKITNVVDLKIAEAILKK